MLYFPPVNQYLFLKIRKSCKVNMIGLLYVSQGLFQERWEKEKWKLSLHIIYPFKMAN